MQILISHGLDVEPNGWNCRYHFADLNTREQVELAILRDSGSLANFMSIAHLQSV